MNRYKSMVCSILCLFFFVGCATSSLKKATEQGATILNDAELYALANSNTIRLISSDFDSYLFFSPDGSLSASSIFNYNLDYGHWDITDEGKLCIKFNVWYYGDLNCYGVYLEGKGSEYLFFTDNGSLAYTGRASTGNSQQLVIKTKKDKKTVFVRSSMSQGQTADDTRSAPTPAAAAPLPEPLPVAASTGSGASQEEIAHTVKSMAKDCPGCNFEDADLRQADLIGANLKDANLQGADLSRANLRRANLEGADLRGATLLSTNLPGANLKDADLTGADLTGSNLIQADFTDAALDNIILDNTLQEGAKGLK